MSLVYVQHHEYTVDSQPAEEQYGNWSETSDFIIDGVALDTKLRWGYDAVQIAPAVVVGDPVWVLYMTYSTGDSFGCHHGKGEVIWVFVDEAVATKNLNSLESLRGPVGEMASFTFTDEDGEVLHMSNPANDYFSSVEGFHLQPCIVGECPPPRY